MKAISEHDGIGIFERCKICGEQSEDCTCHDYELVDDMKFLDETD